MKIKELFPNFNVPVIFKDLDKEAGMYWHKSDVIVLSSDLKKSMPACAKIVLLHEMMHATGSKKRLMRIERLAVNFGPYIENSLAYKVEECIAEVACMVATIKLGLFNEYSKTVILPGLEKYYTSDVYIPIREVRAALKYFADEGESFEEEIEAAKLYLEAYLDVKFQDSYTQEESA